MPGLPGPALNPAPEFADSFRARTLTLLAALAWGVGFFGVIERLVVPLKDEQFL